jgi:HEAT repeat protein
MIDLGSVNWLDPLVIVAAGVLGLTAIVLALSVVVIAHHMVTDRERKRNRERFESASMLLAPRLVANDALLDEAVADARRSCGDRAAALVLRKARFDLRGPVIGRITSLLTEMGEVARLRKEMRSRREWKRAVAVRGLGECGGEEARASLLDAAEDEAPDVRRAAREGLLNDGSTEAVQAAIRSFLTDLPRRAGWRRSFYARLASVSAEQLTQLIDSGGLSPAEEKLAIEALGDAGHPAALALAMARIHSPDAEARATAVRVFGKAGRRGDVPIILSALRDPEWFVRAAAARSIESILNLPREVRGDDEWIGAVCSRLEDALRDPSWWVRANAARALARSGPLGVDTLMESVSSPDRYARDAAVAALSMATVTPERRLEIRRHLQSFLPAVPVPAVTRERKAVML